MSQKPQDDFHKPASEAELLDQMYANPDTAAAAASHEANKGKPPTEISVNGLRKDGRTDEQYVNDLVNSVQV